MRAIVAAIGWEGLSFDPAEVWQRIARLSPEIGVGGAWDVCTGEACSLGCAGEGQGRWGGAVGVLARAGILTAGDCRLVDREALARAVDCARQPSTDLDLVISAYLQWAHDFPAHLTGDFSVIVYDDARQQVVLAVGGSGARQLYYRAFARGVMVASHPSLLQGITPLRRSDVDATTVCDYLLGCHRDPRRTFFSDVTRVPPGHQVVLRSDSTISRRHFVPPVPREDHRTSADCLAEFRDLFEVCVTDAVDRGANHGVHLSGGLDSSSIAMTLPRIETGGASFELLTAVFPTIRACNEMSTVAAVAHCLPFPARYWDAERTPDLEVEVARSTWPLGVVPTAIANRDDLELAASAGAGVVLSGDGGDGLAMESAVFRDLSHHHQWRLLWDELAAPEFLGFARRYLLRQVVRDALRRLVGRGLPRVTRLPPWFGPALLDREEESSVPESNHADRLPDLVQRQVWNAMTDPTDMWVVEGLSQRASRVGVEVRCPYRDPRLTSFVAGIPYDRRLCGGTLRRLQREGLADRLPLKVRQRLKVDFSLGVRALVRNEWRTAKPLLDTGEWCAEPYIPRTAFDALVESALGEGNADFRDWNRVRRIWTLELWLRRQAL